LFKLKNLKMKTYIIWGLVIVAAIIVAGIAQSKLQSLDNGYNYAGEEYQ
jgi:hypothetical protein